MKNLRMKSTMHFVVRVVCVLLTYECARMRAAAQQNDLLKSTDVINNMQPELVK
jgi:hypothetical protein